MKTSLMNNWILKLYLIPLALIVLCSSSKKSYPIVYSSKDSGNREIFLTDTEGKSKIKITNHPGSDGWSADGSKIIFASDNGEYLDIYIMNKDGSSVRKFIDNGSQPSWLK